MPFESWWRKQRGLPARKWLRLRSLFCCHILFSYLEQLNVALAMNTVNCFTACESSFFKGLLC